MSLSGISANNYLYSLYQSCGSQSGSSAGSSSADFSTALSSLTTGSSGGSNQISDALSLLLKALDTENLSSAQGVFSLLQRDDQTMDTDSTLSPIASASSTDTGSNPLAEDFSELEEALQSGDLTTARSCLSQIMQHMQPPPPPADAASAADSILNAAASASSNSSKLDQLLQMWASITASTVKTNSIDSSV